MEPKYLDDNFDEKRMAPMSALLDKFKPKLPSGIVTKKRGGLNEITSLREETAKLIGKPFGQVSKLTNGWSRGEIYSTLNEARKFTKNPGACWWIIYKKKKDIYGKTKERVNKERLPRVGKERRSKDSPDQGQETLFTYR